MHLNPIGYDIRTSNFLTCVLLTSRSNEEQQRAAQNRNFAGPSTRRQNMGICSGGHYVYKQVRVMFSEG